MQEASGRAHLGVACLEGVLVAILTVLALRLAILRAALLLVRVRFWPQCTVNCTTPRTPEGAVRRRRDAAGRATGTVHRQAPAAAAEDAGCPEERDKSDRAICRAAAWDVRKRREGRRTKSSEAKSPLMLLLCSRRPRCRRVIRLSPSSSSLQARAGIPYAFRDAQASKQNGAEALLTACATDGRRARAPAAA